MSDSGSMIVLQSNRWKVVLLAKCNFNTACTVERFGSEKEEEIGYSEQEDGKV